MSKLVTRLFRIAAVLVFLGFSAWYGAPHVPALKSYFADRFEPIASQIEMQAMGEQIAGKDAALEPAKTPDEAMQQALDEAKGIEAKDAVASGYAPRELGDADLKTALDKADITLLTKAVAAELARQNFVASEIKRNPAVIAQALVLWGKEQQGTLVPEIKDGEIEAALLARALDEKTGVILGNHDAPFTVVEFIDPNCPHCRIAIPEILAWIDREPRARILFREFPVIAEQSQSAARVALALGAQGLYRGWLEAVAGWKGGVLDGAAARAIAEKLGADMPRLDAALNAAETTKAIADSLEIGAALQIDGTPAAIYGRKLVVGSASVDWIADFAAQQGGPLPAGAAADPQTQDGHAH